MNSFGLHNLIIYLTLHKLNDIRICSMGKEHVLL